MKDISLHILDIVQNSVVAQATNIEIKIEVDKKNDYLALFVNDNGKGMSPEFLKQVPTPTPQLVLPAKLDLVFLC